MNKCDNQIKQMFFISKHWNFYVNIKDLQVLTLKPGTRPHSCTKPHKPTIIVVAVLKRFSRARDWSSFPLLC